MSTAATESAPASTEHRQSFIKTYFPATRSSLGWRAAVLVMFLLLAAALFGDDWSRYAIIAPLVAVYVLVMIAAARRPD